MGFLLHEQLHHSVIVVYRGNPSNTLSAVADGGTIDTYNSSGKTMVGDGGGAGGGYDGGGAGGGYDDGFWVGGRGQARGK
jgi:hypothetical protein